MKGQRVVRFVLVVALVIGVTGYVASVVAQTAPAPSTRTAIKQPPPFTKPDRPDTPRKVPAAKAGTAATAPVTYSAKCVSGQALHPKFSSMDYDYIGMGGGCLYALTTTDEPFCTQIDLPQGATIYALDMYFYRLDINYNCVGYLSVYDSYGQIAFQYPINTGGWTGWNWGNTTGLTHTVDNNSYRYLLEWVPLTAGSDMSLASFKVYMMDPPAAPGKVAVIPLY